MAQHAACLKIYKDIDRLGGHSNFSVAIVQFLKGKLTVLCERSDKVGGRDMDECLIRAFAAQHLGARASRLRREV